MSAALELEKVGISFGGLRAVDNVSLTVAPGEIRGLIGPNGAGKSTLVNITAGEQRRHDGRVRLLGQDVTGVRATKRISDGLARTFQRPEIATRLTIRENVELAVGSGRGDLAEAEKMLADLDLSGWLDIDGKHVPYPVLKIIDTVRAVVARPAVLLADEPAAGLTTEDREKLVDLLRTARDRMEMTIVLIEHDVPLVFELCERVSVLDSGVLIADGPADEVRRRAEVIEAYLGVGSENA
ncbi:ATP-binding cassette domain-containing protein [Actinoplanes bogorensis]|uniref:ATP-binding cassette domain-containing protein n=1 Tax=Paractinoplanes bogorensis TaxID=1610840 RepID=A0ABS5YUS0_9ACTN|nr:ATP-binding cassette domain-containing protein [Actinoplanes bogorensis]MBU2667192.1 ATP-binding cassette domain-containing protein [Actinoplanes bogorensis]